MSGIKQNPGLFRIVVTHYVAAAFCFLVLSGMILFSVKAFTGHYFHPQILAITHMAALGWGTMIIPGASYQLIPVVLETDLYSERLAWLSFALFVPGLIALVYSFWVFVPGIHMQCGAILLLLAVVLFTVNVYLTAKKKKQETIQEDFIFSACICLCLTVTLGTALVFNFTLPIFPQDHLHFLKLHAHTGLIGWFLLMLIGVSSKLLPMFPVSSYQSTKLLTYSYYLIVGALLYFLIDSYLFGLSLRTYLIFAIGAAGMACYFIFILKCLRSRLRKHIDLPMITSLLSFILLKIATLSVPVIIYFHLKNNPLTIRFSMIYGEFMLMGWITALILGQTFKTLPFIVWVKHYEHLTGKLKTPMPADLFANNLLKAQTVSYPVFCLTFMPGCYLLFVPLIYTGTAALIVTALLYLSNVFIVLFHKTVTYGKL
ncbi:cytochrome C oxidase subunit I [Mucilaginibacter sp. S1162]|uniref:Cytochrome C oxidase subunit I n=1 Tax=Mucilaginibacter humi TaxID=2732510 RepID=A0ABX1VZS9_9SPHI|nr:cytochrome C oxidase subunit I [Mucilaginibacter humi]NNU33134.1 cytochrome C oxidase subunit I [Mucilaginibacter humi]